MFKIDKFSMVISVLFGLIVLFLVMGTLQFYIYHEEVVLSVVHKEITYSKVSNDSPLIPSYTVWGIVYFHLGHQGQRECFNTSLTNYGSLEANHTYIAIVNGRKWFGANRYISIIVNQVE